MTYKAFKYRIYPTAPQEEKINQNIGCARFVYNQLLDDRIKVYRESKQRPKKTYCDLKKEYAFLKEADSRALLNARENLDAAYDKFFKESNAGFPKFNMTRAGIPRALARGRNASNQIISQKHLTFPKTRV